MKRKSRKPHPDLPEVRYIVNPIYEYMLKDWIRECSETGPTNSFDDKPKLSRANLHPTVAGYVKGFLNDWPMFSTYTIDDIDEFTYQQMVRDIAHFFWNYRDSVEVATWFNADQVLEDMGERLWHSRQGNIGGFDYSTYELKDLYHDYARLSLRPLDLIEKEDGTIGVDYTEKRYTSYEQPLIHITPEVPADSDFRFDIPYDREDPFGFESLEKEFRFDI